MQPLYLGLALIFCGILTLVVSLWEYRWILRYLWGGDFAAIAGMTKEGKQTPMIAVTIVLILVGVATFFAVLFRLCVAAQKHDCRVVCEKPPMAMRPTKKPKNRKPKAEFQKELFP